MEYDALLNSLDSYGSSVKEITYSVPMDVKLQSLFWIFAEALLVILLGLRCIEKGNKASKILAMIGLGFGALSVILQIALICELFPYMESRGFFSYTPTTMGKITLFATFTMAVMICGALVSRIKNSEKLVNLLKIIALSTGGGFWLIITILIFMSDFQNSSKLLSIGNIFLSCFFVCWITALIMSKFGKKDNTAELNVVKEEIKVEDAQVNSVPLQSSENESVEVQIDETPLQPSQNEIVESPVQELIDSENSSLG